MFLGSLPHSILSIIHENVKKWDVQDIAIACSGNFTIERELQGKYSIGSRGFHSCDVTIYSCSVGALLSGGQPPSRVRASFEEDLGWLNGYMTDPISAVATMMLCTRLFEGFWKKENVYYARQTKAYLAQWPDLHKATCDRVRAAAERCKLRTFHAGDAVEWVRDLPDEYGIISFPPFMTGGYEKMWERLAEVFDWEPPEYVMMDKLRRDEMLGYIMAKRHWMFGLADRLEALEDHIHGIAQTTLRGVPIYVYANTDKTRIVQPRTKLEPVTIPRLAKGEEIGSTLHLERISTAQFASLRAQYLNVNIKPGTPTVTMGVLVDGKLIGAYAISPPKAGVSIQGGVSYAYLMSDFAVAPTDYGRLAKLVLIAALSKEAKEVAEGMLNRRCTTLVTTAFTKRPVSMKYRGLFRLTARKELAEDPNNVHLAGAFMLQYQAEYGQWSLQEGMAKWRKQHSKASEPESSE